MADIELKPCPFCGSSDIIFEHFLYEEVWGKCKNCGAQSGAAEGKTKDEAIKVWNRRTADVAPVVHGHWIDKGYYVTTAYGSIPVMTCSVCNAEITIDNSYDDYCPNCGAKMDGKDGEHNE